MISSKVNSTSALQLRFTGFNDEWNTLSISELGKVVTGSTPDTSDRSLYGGDFMFVSPSDIGDARYVEDTTKTLSEAGHKKGRRIPKGSILFVCIGSTIGKVAQAGGECTTNQQINAVVPDTNHDANFLLCVLDKASAKIRLLAGKQAVPLINKSTFAAISITIPSLPEQRKIADFLTAVDGRIAQLVRKKALLEDYKKGVMQQLFTQALRFKDDHGNNFPEWEETEFGQIAKRANEKHNPMTSENEYPSVELESLDQGTGQLLQLFSSTDQKSIKNKFIKGDVLFGKLRPYLRKWLMASFDGICSSEIWVLRGRVVCNPYLYQLIQSDEFMKATNVSSGSKMPRADWHHIAAVSFSYPASSAEQTKIANFLTALDRKIATVSTQITETQTWKKGLLQQMFV